MYLIICRYVGSGTLSQSFLMAFLSLFIIPVYMYFCHKITINLARLELEYHFVSDFGPGSSAAWRGLQRCANMLPNPGCVVQNTASGIWKNLLVLDEEFIELHKCFPCLIRSPMFSNVAQLPRSLLLAVDKMIFLTVVACEIGRNSYFAGTDQRAGSGVWWELWVICCTNSDPLEI